MSHFPSIIPRPLELEGGDGNFQLSRDTSFYTNTPLAQNAVAWFVDEFYRQSGISLRQSETKTSGTVALRFQNDLAPENYILSIQNEGIEIRASEARGFLYGAVSLFQCIPFDSPGAVGQWQLPALEIRDAPRFGWRGLMLDSARHFQPVSWVKKFIDTLVLHKFNVLHWHLTEDQGWRIEIDKYRALTSVSAWRKHSRVGHELKASTTDFDGRPHGGFYSKAELREVVAYAAARGVTIVPEIEMPGHAKAVLAAYPELSCTGGPFEVETKWGIHDDVFCAGNDDVIRFLEDVLEEVLEIFPSQFIHVGGDECHKTRWKECLKCQARIKHENLADENELQSWFVRHFDTFLTARGRRLIGWDEILEGGLAQNAAVMSWRGEEGGIAAARAGHDVVMAPNQQTYLDYYQSANRASEPLAIGGDLSLAKVYAYEPIPESLTPEEAKHVLGGQGQLWTEYMPRPEIVEYMAYPRACALAETLWSPAQPRAFDEFLPRLKAHLRLLDRLHLNYRQVD
ncbi:beta-hexosaminidase [Abditibacteriota bacterium]|nr:beta-hexosaminidase [Abditibacteriota bacterium]